MITVDTKLIALLGNPLRQSFSNILQNETYKQLELDYYYFPIETRKENGVLEDIVKGIRRQRAMNRWTIQHSALRFATTYISTTGIK